MSHLPRSLTTHQSQFIHRWMAQTRMCALQLLLLLLAVVGPCGCSAQIDILPRVVDSFCDQNRDFQTDSSGSVLSKAFNYTLCMDVGTKSWSMVCTQAHPCPSGPDAALTVYTGGVSYSVDYAGKCTKHPCQNLAQCDPPDGMPFSFLLLDDDSRGVASRVGTVTLDGLGTFGSLLDYVVGHRS